MENQKPQEDKNAKLIESIKKFAASYKTLTPAGKTAFQNQVTAQMRTMDDRTKKLYEALIEATKNEYNVDRTIKEMEKADRAAKAGI